MNTYYFYNYPSVMGTPLVPYVIPQISASNWFDAMKNLYMLKKDIDITNIIISDQLRNARRANIMYGMRNGHRIANINMFPYMLPQNMQLGIATTNPNMMYPMNVAGPMMYSQNKDGVMRSGTFNVGANAIGPLNVMRPMMPLGSYPYPGGFFAANKNIQE